MNQTRRADDTESTDERTTEPRVATGAPAAELEGDGETTEPLAVERTAANEPPTVLADTEPEEGFVFDEDLPDAIVPTIETVQVGAVTVTDIPDDVVIADVETDSDLAIDPFVPYHEDDDEFNVVFEVDGNHTLDVRLEVQEDAADGVGPYDPTVHTIGFEAEREDGDVAVDSITAGVMDATPTVGTYADSEDGVIRNEGLRDAIDDWRDSSIETNVLRETIDAWRSDDSVAFAEVSDQAIDGTEITVDAATYNGHAWGAHAHRFTYEDGMGGTIGVSEEFEAGEVVEDFTIPLDRLDEPLDQDQNLMVMLHVTNEDGGYDGNDANWVWVGGEPVTDIAFFEIE